MARNNLTLKQNVILSKDIADKFFINIWINEWLYNENFIFNKCFRIFLNFEKTITIKK